MLLPEFLITKSTDKNTDKKIRQCRMKSIITDKTSIKDVCIFCRSSKQMTSFLRLILVFCKSFNSSALKISKMIIEKKTSPLECWYLGCSYDRLY